MNSEFLAVLELCGCNREHQMFIDSFKSLLFNSALCGNTKYVTQNAISWS